MGSVSVPRLDKAGPTVDFLLRADRDRAAARRIFNKVIDQHCAPGSVTIAGSPPNLAALHDINAERETPIVAVPQWDCICSTAILFPGRVWLLSISGAYAPLSRQNPTYCAHWSVESKRQFFSMLRRSEDGVQNTSQHSVSEISALVALRARTKALMRCASTWAVTTLILMVRRTTPSLFGTLAAMDVTPSRKFPLSTA